MSVLAAIAAALCGAGCVQTLAGWGAVSRFAHRALISRAGMEAADLPAVTVLKPLHGDEPLLEQALASTLTQDYPLFQVVFGVQHHADPALAVVSRLRLRFPLIDVSVVVNAAQHGANRKVSNLINMAAAAKHDVLVIADSDLHVQPDWLRQLAAALRQPGAGMATTLYAGLPATTRLAARLGAAQITHLFLPGVVLARMLGRQDSLGATMALRRETLERIGGFRALVDHLADDNVLGRKVQALGLAVRLADTVPATTVPEPTLRALFIHELRWARTIRALVPLEFAASAVQLRIFWAAVAIVASAGAPWSWGLFALAWLLAAMAGRGVDRGLAPLLEQFRFRCPVLLLPLREVFSVAVMLASYAGRRVDWRGHSLHADTPAAEIMRAAALHPSEGLSQR